MAKFDLFKLSSMTFSTF